MDMAEVAENMGRRGCARHLRLLALAASSGTGKREKLIWDTNTDSLPPAAQSFAAARCRHLFGTLETVRWPWTNTKLQAYFPARDSVR